MMTFIRTWLNFPIESLPIAAAQSFPGRRWHVGHGSRVACARGGGVARRARSPGPGPGGNGLMVIGLRVGYIKAKCI